MEITKINGKNVFAQNSTGGVLLYGTGLEDKGMDKNGGNAIVGKFTVKAKAYKGLPEITKIVDQSADANIGAWSGKFPCFEWKDYSARVRWTIADIEANYPMFVNAKCKITNVEVTKAFGATKAGEIKDASGKIDIYNYSTDITVDIPVGAKAEYTVVWPTVFNTHQLGIYEKSRFKLTSAPSAITMPATLKIAVGADPVDLKATSFQPNATISFVSSNPEAATVSDAGVVTAVAAGETTISASVEEATVDGVKYTATTATCVVTVTEGGTEPETATWEQASLATITASDLFVVVGMTSDGSYFALSNDKGTSAAPTAVAVTVADGKISSEVTNNLIWSMTASEAGFSVHPNGDTTKWLYCTNSNNGVRVGTNDAKTFKVDGSTGYFVHNGTSRIVGIYNKQDWRCYTEINSNIQNQRFLVFKKVVK